MTGRHRKSLGHKVYWRCPVDGCLWFVGINLDTWQETQPVHWLFGIPEPMWEYLSKSDLEKCEAMVEEHESTHLERRAHA